MGVVGPSKGGGKEREVLIEEDVPEQEIAAPSTEAAQTDYSDDDSDLNNDLFVDEDSDDDLFEEEF